jgi:hypothetical protein
MLNVTVREFLRFLLIPFAFITINLVELTAAVIAFSRSSAATSVTLLNTVVTLSCKPATLLLTTVISGAFDLNAETVLLNADIRAVLTGPVSLGGGMITFSHGTLPVPAPATQNIIKRFNIPVKQGPVNFELFTPTGAAILAALFPETATDQIPENEDLITGTSRGTKDLDIPPLKVYLK